MNNDKNSSWLTYAQASEFLNVPVATLYTWVSRRRIPFTRLTRRMVRFNRTEIENWLAARAVATGGTDENR